jgi:putative tryptophan/tyrosine transport system substrate-binding protein
MRRREFITLLGGAAAAWPLAARAQQSDRIWRVGVLSLRSSGSPPIVETLAEGLRDYSYFNGQNMIIEFRSANDRAELLAELAAELIALRVDVIIAVASQAVRAARQATSTIPIVMTSSSDPVGVGFAASLARPGGNITGLSQQAPEATGKRMELLKEIVPSISRIAVFWNPEDPPAASSLREATASAVTLKLNIREFETRVLSDFIDGFKAAKSERADAVILLPAPLMTAHAGSIAALAVKHRLPTISYTDEFPKNGGLISYGPSLNGLYRRAAYFVDRILKGANPADLPIEQPTKFELVINLKTAKEMGIEIPAALLARADEVIE